MALRMPNIAPLRNVLLLRGVLDQLRARSSNLPGVAVFYGRAGVGKSNACAAAAAGYNAIYVEMRDHFTRKSFLLAILGEMGLKPEHTAAEIFNQVCQELVLSRRPLILDMGDYLVKRKLVDTLLDLYEGSGAAIVLVGEERFPASLQRASERFYDRVLVWCPAVLCDREDARKLANLYARDVEIRDDLLERVVERAGGVARKIAVNIENIRADGKKAGLRSVGLKEWGDKPLYNGEPPRRSV
jgi:DNA transposition AAA+ family ATPase